MKLIGQDITTRKRDMVCWTGTWLLTTLLLPVLEKSTDARVVCLCRFISCWPILTCVCVVQITVSSGGMLLAKLNVSDIQLSKANPFKGDEAYSQHKV